MKKTLTAVFIVTHILILIYLFDKPLMLEIFDWMDGTPKKENYAYVNGKIAPLTVLSQEDAKKPCNSCHTK